MSGPYSTKFSGPTRDWVVVCAKRYRLSDAGHTGRKLSGLKSPVEKGDLRDGDANESRAALATEGERRTAVAVDTAASVAGRTGER